MNRLAERVIREFYGRLAWAYEPGVWLLTLGLWRRAVQAVECLVTAGPVLDVGCGPGILVEHLARRGHQVTGIDLSPQMIELSRRRLAKAGLAAQVVQADARQLPFPDASIGTIINTFPTSYVAQERTWAEYARVLRPGGRWVWVTSPDLSRFQPRLLGLYLFLLFEHGRWWRKRDGGLSPVSEQLFPKQEFGRVTDGPARVYVRILTRR